MNKDYVESVNTAGRQAYDFGRQLAEINLRAFDNLTAAQVKLWGDSVEKGFSQARRLADAKGPRDVLDVQMDMARELSQAAVEHGRQSVELLTGTRDELVKVYQKGFEQAAAEAQKAAPGKAA